MNSNEAYFFSELKQKVETTFLKSHAVASPMKDWKGDDIVLFQEDLFKKAKGRVSEKWFYTYIKNTPEKLPRIDVLNLLSIYAGYTNWNTFKAEHENHQSSSKYKRIGLVVLLIILVVISVWYSASKSENTFEFCFIDAIKNERITSIPLDIKILQDDESPLYFKTDSLGCFTYTTRKDVITFTVESPYHKTDTITRRISSKGETVKIDSDDYALMLHFYTNGNIKDWTAHQTKLKALFAHDAKIYRLFKNDLNIELYSRDEFIRMLTIPTQSLKRTSILDKTVRNGKITSLKFMVK